jgi:hypothetical protein
VKWSEHLNFVGNYFGIQLGYGRKTGYGGYGPAVGTALFWSDELKRERKRKREKEQKNKEEWINGVWLIGRGVERCESDRNHRKSIQHHNMDQRRNRSQSGTTNS